MNQGITALLVVGVVMLQALITGGGIFNGNFSDRAKRNNEDISNDNSAKMIEEFEAKMSLDKAGFLENKGRIEDHEIQFYYSTPSFSIGFKSCGYAVSLSDQSQEKEMDITSVYETTFLGSSECSPEGIGPIDRSFHFNDWEQSGLSTGTSSAYQQILYSEIYPFIDLIFYFNEEGIKYDWFVMPGGNVSDIRIHYEGVHALTLLEDGTLEISTQVTTVIENSPVTYQNYGNEIKSVKSSYHLLDNDILGYEIEDYDHTQPLVIDPLIATTFFNGDSTTMVIDLVLDSEDNVYIVGSTYSDWFPTVPGTYEHRGTNWFTETFFCKFNKRLSKLEFAGLIGGDCHDIAKAVSLDSNGNVFIAGVTRSSDFPTTPDAYNHSIDFAGFAGYLFILNPDGTELLYSTLFPGTGFLDMIMDEDDIPILLGAGGEGIPTTPGSQDNGTNSSSTSGFVVKFDPWTSQPKFCSYLGGSNVDQPTQLDMGPDGNIFISGFTLSQDFPTTPGCFNSTGGEGNTAFVSKLNGNASKLLYSTLIGECDNTGVKIAVDDFGYATITGTTNSENFPTTPGCFDDSYEANGDIFVTRLGHNGTELEFSTYLGGNDTKWDHGNGIAIDSKGNIHITGESNSEHFPTTPGCFDRTFHGGGGMHGMGDCILAVFEPDGNLAYSTYIGGSGEDFSNGITIDSEDNPVIIGYFRITPDDFPIVQGGYNTIGGEACSMIYRFATNLNPLAWIESVSPDPALDTDTIKFQGRPFCDSQVMANIWTVDGEEIYNGTDTFFEYSALTSGDHTIGYQILNAEGYHSGQRTTTITVHSRPVAEILSLNPNPALDTDRLHLVGRGTDDGTIVQYSWKIGGLFMDSPISNLNLTTLSSGIYSVHLRVMDNFGIWSNWTFSDVVVVERPVAEIHPLDKDVYASDQLVTINCFSMDGRDIDRVIWNSAEYGILYSGEDTTATFSGFGVGNHTISLCVLDEYGFWSNLSYIDIRFTDRPSVVMDAIEPSVIQPGRSVNFKGVGSDDEMITHYIWTSSIDGVLMNGFQEEFMIDDLSLGTHIITLIGIDNHGYSSDEVTSQIVVTTPPIATILTVPSGPIVVGESMVLSGWGTDDESIELYSWMSSIDGVIHEGEAANITLTDHVLSSGSHTISFKVRDNRGFWSETVSSDLDLIVHDRPKLVIESITPSVTILDQEISFQGTAVDDDMVTTIQWISNIDGLLNNEKSFSTTSLSRGTHTIVLRAMDSNGAWGENVSATVTVMQRPVARITGDNAEVAIMGKLISFSGYGSDDGAIQRYRWTSSIDGILSNEKIFSISTLSHGVHLISFSVMDKNGLWSDGDHCQMVIHEKPIAEIVGTTPDAPSIHDVLSLSGQGSDDGSIIQYYWYSSIDGELFNGSWDEASCSPLSKGNHTIFFRVQDDHGVWSSEDSITLLVTDSETGGQGGEGEGEGIMGSPLLMLFIFVLIALLGLIVAVIKLPNDYFKKQRN